MNFLSPSATPECERRCKHGLGFGVHGPPVVFGFGVQIFTGWRQKKKQKEQQAAALRILNYTTTTATATAAAAATTIIARMQFRPPRPPGCPSPGSGMHKGLIRRKKGKQWFRALGFWGFRLLGFRV